MFVAVGECVPIRVPRHVAGGWRFIRKISRSRYNRHRYALIRGFESCSRRAGTVPSVWDVAVQFPSPRPGAPRWQYKSFHCARRASTLCAVQGVLTNFCHQASLASRGPPRSSIHLHHPQYSSETVICDSRPTFQSTHLAKVHRCPPTCMRATSTPKLLLRAPVSLGTLLYRDTGNLGRLTQAETRGRNQRIVALYVYACRHHRMHVHIRYRRGHGWGRRRSTFLHPNTVTGAGSLQHMYSCLKSCPATWSIRAVVPC